MNIRWFRALFLLGWVFAFARCDDSPPSPDAAVDGSSDMPVTQNCTLTVTVAGPGTVSSQPAGIACGTTCQATFACGQQVQLSATMNGAMLQTTWGDACTGTHYGVSSMCSFALTDNKTVTVKTTPAICSADDYCWQNPLPQGNALRGVWGSDANNVWAVGDAGTILRWNGTAWAAHAAGTTAALNGVWGTDASNVWAVGAGGAILKWNGTAWAAQTSGTTQPLYGVWGTDASNVWAVGGSGTIVKTI